MWCGSGVEGLAGAWQSLASAELSASIALHFPDRLAYPGSVRRGDLCKHGVNRKNVTFLK